MRWALILILIPQIAFGSVGEIGKIKGSGALERGSESIEAINGVGVQTMDTAVTARGRMQIDFLDDTRVDITEHSRLLIDEFVYDPDQSLGKLSIKATLGTVRYASGQIAKRYQQNVKIRTPSATIGVRGTDFIMVVDELGGSMITLLPSCDIDGNCYTGEITVDTDVGQVILNQAFQATMTTTRWDKPAKPLLLDIDENQINQLIILRKRNPYVDEEYEEYIQRKRLADFLGIDFLDFDGLDYDALQEGIKDIWVTELDQTDYMLQDVLHDILDQLNQALYNMFRDELMRQNKQFFVEDAIKYGFDPETGITLEKEDGNWVVQRRDPITNSYFRLKLNRGNDYSINMKQGEWEIYDYKLGIDGGNRIDIEQ
ncbi:MAG: hypothetical protein CBE00_13120 [Planctomycetaceae bacterium TMED240]|nr:MAG: hypothetical protein CBE00_13120 [Planctomycetaceae bacterium TMED240]